MGTYGTKRTRNRKQEKIERGAVLVAYEEVDEATAIPWRQGDGIAEHPQKSLDEFLGPLGSLFRAL